ncbi:hypothetical protein RchiOBHm_Chr6g0275341 [Rosa chinensis]|uniref:Uncharacterized protein n=1 Tax=Rosa chinensis TaxID=74649 RepID=A0A2P6PRZ1_ROSCH|nr:hypothetical protein RchiOBHm_Chr6g0275341 [Rosa chinensis]
MVANDGGPESITAESLQNGALLWWKVMILWLLWVQIDGGDGMDQALSLGALFLGVQISVMGYSRDLWKIWVWDPEINDLPICLAGFWWCSDSGRVISSHIQGRGGEDRVCIVWALVRIWWFTQVQAQDSGLVAWTCFQQTISCNLLDLTFVGNSLQSTSIFVHQLRSLGELTCCSVVSSHVSFTRLRFSLVCRLSNCAHLFTMRVTCHMFGNLCHLELLV